MKSIKFLFIFMCLGGINFAQNNFINDCGFHASEFGLTAFAQTTAPKTPTTNNNQISQTPDVFEVRLPVLVLDKKKLPVGGLTKSSFVVFEDKKQQEITFFSDEKQNTPLSVGVLMDTSPSTAGKIKFAKDAAKDFLYTVTRPRKDQSAFVTFDNEIKMRQDFTDKLDLLDKAVDKVKETGTQTSLYDAIYQFCDEKMRGAKGRRVIVVITDGEDTFSRAELSDAIDIAQRTDTTIFAISTKAGFSGSVPGVDAGTVKDKGDKELDRLCEETGGNAFFSGRKDLLERSLTGIANQLRSQYVITYRPDNQNYDGSERKVEVKLVAEDAKKYKLLTKKSYRAVRDRIR